MNNVFINRGGIVNVANGNTGNNAILNGTRGNTRGSNGG